MHPMNRSTYSNKCRPYSAIPIVNDHTGYSKIRIKTGDIGWLFLSIYQPSRPEATAPLIIHLRPRIPTPRSPYYAISELARSSNATVISISYGLDKKKPYPIPVHDVLRGYDWNRKHLSRNHASRIGVCGELIGGSLAAMLALTECHEGKQGITAAAISDPIVDWTALIPTDKGSFGFREEEVALVSRTPDESSVAHGWNTLEGLSYYRQQAASDGLKEGPLSVDDLLTLRKTFFGKPEKYFDPFASPLLFFRTSSSDLPREFSGNDFSSNNLNAEEALAEPGKQRRSHRKYPPTGSGLLLPYVRVEVGKGNALRDQGVELVDFMRRSYERSEAERTASGRSVEKRTFDLVEREGLGFWYKKEMLEIGSWFGQVLREPRYGLATNDQQMA